MIDPNLLKLIYSIIGGVIGGFVLILIDKKKEQMKNKV